MKRYMMLFVVIDIAIGIALGLGVRTTHHACAWKRR